MANLLGGRLVFNTQDKHWYLYEMTGAQDPAKGPETGIIAQCAPQDHGIAVWGTEETGKDEKGLNWKSAHIPFASSYHFGRLGYYARVSNGTLRGAVDTSTPHYLRAGFAGLGLAVMSSTALINPALAANILPQGGTVTSGAGTVSSINNGTGLQIKQNSQVLGLNWNSFSIGVGNQVVFDQPNSTSVAINRVIGNSRTEIFGSLQSNGQVFLLNPNGVLIARTAQIDTGAFVAAAAQDAKRNANGSWSLSGISNADVINQGNIRATGDGGFVVLAGAQVRPP